MRLRWYFNPSAAGQVWPGPKDQPIPAPFNWVKIDNRGPSSLSVGWTASVQASVATDYYLTVPPGSTRVFNVAGPKNGDDSDAWPTRLFLVAAANTTALIEIADHPIVDLVPGDSLLAVQAVGSGGLALPVTDVSLFFTETTAALAANGVFTGPWRDAADFNWFAAVALADVAGTLLVDEADQSAPNVTNLVASQASAATGANQPSPPAAGQVARITPVKTVMRFVRVRYINGAGAQARLNIQSTLSPLN